MRIKRLRITGFKSFVDPADLRIEPGLTGVVGPNGCGKSNLLEALRWTMGETSARSMRGAGMEDVIFAGTATRPPRDFAEVSLLAERDGEETEIVRRIDRGAGSAYRIDGRDVRAKDVGLLFADAATGAHSPALVSQGRIGAVIAAKPADRRAMLEEAAGIAGLHVRRRDAEARLRATEANLARLDEIIADQDARAAALRRQARAAERYRDLSARIHVGEARALFARWRDAAAAAEQARREAAAAEDGVAAAAAEERTAADFQQRAAETLALARGAALAARDKAGDAAHRLAGLVRDKADLEARVAATADALARIADDQAREGTLAADAAAALERLTGEIAGLDSRIADADAARPALDATLAEAERHARDAEVALARGLSRQAAEAAEARIAAAALDAAGARLQRAEREQAAVAQALAELGDPAPLLAEREQALTALDAAMGAASFARTALDAADGDERGAVGLRNAAQESRATAHATLAALEGEAAALVRAGERGGRDRLLDHIRAAPGYERAVAAALGDDLEIGLDPAACSFWSSAAGVGVPSETEDDERLSAHVAAPAFLAARLARILVAEDDGRTLSVGERLVTRDGRMRRWDGLVVANGGIAAAERLARRNRLSAIGAELPPARQAVERASTALTEAEERIGLIRAEARRTRETLARAEAETRDARILADRAASRIERLAGNRADLDARMGRIADECAAAAAERVRTAVAAAALPEGSTAAALVETLQRAAGDARAAVAGARAERSALDRDLAAARERRAAAQADVRSWRSRAGEAAKRVAAMSARRSELGEAAADLAERPAALAAQIAAATAEHDAARASAEILHGAERDAEAALRTAEATQRQTIEALSTAREHRAGASARAEHGEARRRELGAISGERFGCPAPVLPERIGFLPAELGDAAAEGGQHDRLVAERERIGPVNLVAERELAELEAASTGNAAERTELGEAVARLRGAIGTLNREGRQRLRAAFEAVDTHFRRLFTTLFDGGQAHLALVDSDDPLEAGLEIMAQPPGKRLQSLTLLSGGEQALTAVALIFALFLTNPAPICVLDEVDAPLDNANIERFCDLLDRMARDTDTRYLIVTHNAVTMSRMHRLFGVTMIERGVSRLVSVDLRAAEMLAAE